MNTQVTLPVCAAATVVMLLGACGSTASPSGSVSASASPSANAFASAKFSTVVPVAWSDATGNQTAVGSINAGGQVLMLLLYANSPSLNEHIDVSLSAQPVPQDQLAGYLQSVSRGGATNLSQPQSFNLDGETGIFITYNLASTGGTVLKAQDMVINHNSDTYDIVLNTAQADFTLQAAALQEVLAHWKWTG